MRHAVIVTVAGSSCRFNENSNSKQKKEFLKLDGHSVLYRAVKPFTEVDGLAAVLITYKKDKLDDTVSALENLDKESSVPFIFVEGGVTRQQSVFNALRELDSIDARVDFVSIHDGARPFVTKNLIERTLKSAAENGASAPAVSISDTLVQKDEKGFVCGRVDRSGVFGIQTPQVFIFSEILSAHEMAAQNPGKKYTDDTEIYGDYGNRVALIEGDPKNTKITYRDDLCTK